MRDRFIPFGAEDESHRGVLSGVCPMLPGIIEIQVHLAGIGLREFPGFEINENEAPQSAVKKHQADAIPFIPDAQALLAGDEGEVVAEFEQEVLKMKNERLFQVLSEYSSFKPRNSSTSGSFISSSAVTRSSSRLRCPLRSRAALFRESAVRS